MDNQSRPNDNFQDPLINCVFLHDQFSSQIFINIYYTPTQTMKYFRFSIDTKEIVSEIVDYKMEETSRNFPLTSIYDSFRHYCYVFFRQGMAYMIDMDSFTCEEQRLLDWDMSSLFLYNNKVLMLKSSSLIRFYHIENIVENLLKNANKLKFTKFFEIDIQGFIHYQKGSDSFQIVTDTHVYFYRFEDEGAFVGVHDEESEVTKVDT